MTDPGLYTVAYRLAEDPMEPFSSSAALHPGRSPNAALTLLRTDPFASLNQGEYGVLELLATGATNAQIARLLDRSEGTIRNITAHLTVKLGVVDRTQAALMGFRAGLGRPKGVIKPMELR